MGRITVFTRSDDLNSKQLVKELERRSLPYKEIDVALYPSRAQDLHAIVNAPPSVPHAFFNTRYVGGLEACLSELAKWDKMSLRYGTALDKYTAEIAAAFDPTHVSLTLPTTKGEAEEPAKARKCPTELKLPDGTMVGVRELMEHLRMWVPVDKHEYQQTVYPQTFTGRTLSASLQKGLELPEADAIRFAKKLVKERVVRHVDTSREHASFEYEHVYQLQCDAQPRILNSYLIWPEKTQQQEPSLLEPLNPIELVDNLHRLLNVMELSSIDPDDGLLNSKHCVSLLKFAKMDEAMCELQQVSKARLLLMSEHAMTAFALNLYSLLVRYAYLKIGIPKTPAARDHWLQETKFLLAGDTYTLQDWWNILLGKSSFLEVGNAKSSASMGGDGTSSTRDTSSSYQEETTSYSSDNSTVKHDKRVLMALFNGPYAGSRWTTAFARYSEYDLDEQLDDAAQVFCLDDHHVRVNRKEHTLELLGSVFQAHRSNEFCKKESGLPKAVMPFLTGMKRMELSAMMNNSPNKPIKIVYLDGPILGSHTIEGPWYKKTYKESSSSSCGNKRVVAVLKKKTTTTTAKKDNRSTAAASTNNSLPSTSSHSSRPQ